MHCFTLFSKTCVLKYISKWYFQSGTILAFADFLYCGNDSEYSMNRILHQDAPKCSFSLITEWRKIPGAGN